MFHTSGTRQTSWVIPPTGGVREFTDDVEDET
jgi:hypothetical protein